MDNVYFKIVHSITVADPDLRIRGGGGGHPDPGVRGRPGLQRDFFGPSGHSLV